MTYTPGEQASPEFLAFFAGDWQRLLETVVVPGMEEDKPSWDRRAAYLLWLLGASYDAEVTDPKNKGWLKVLQYEVSPKVPVSSPVAGWNKPGALPPYVNGGVQFKFPF